MSLLSICKNEKALGFVETLVALTVVGTGMVIVTSMSLRSMRIAKQNENQDVAIQAAVDAMDYLKNPGDIVISSLPTGTPTSYIIEPSTFAITQTTSQTEITANEADCNSSSTTLMGILQNADPTYTVCRQIYIEEVGTDRYDIRVIVVWNSVGSFSKHVITGHRVGEFTL